MTARNLFAAAAVFALPALSACSEETQQDAATTAELAGDDIEANAKVVGEMVEDGAIEAADGISKGAENLRDNLEANDTGEPGPAPITGDDLSTSSDAETPPPPPTN